MLALWLLLSALAGEPALPTLERAHAAPYPPGALEAGLEAEVLLELALDAGGRVIDVQVITAAGHGFDEAAERAAWNFVFTPALDAAGAPVDARIRYLYRFTLDEVPVVCVEGRILVAGTREPPSGASVVLQGPGDALVSTISGPDGRFRVAELGEGPWQLSASAAGLTTETTSIEVVPGEVVVVTLRLAPARPWELESADEAMVVIGYRVAPDVSQRALGADEIRRIPGTGGDIVRAVQSLPGVARTPFNAGQLLIRGTEPADSGVYLGGSPLPIVFHFGGLSTVLNADSLDKVLYLPGGYGVRYGRQLGGVVDLRVDRELPQRGRGYGSVDLYQATLFVEQPVHERTAVTLSARRSYIDRVLSPVVDVDPSVNIQLPRYWDAQLRVLRRSEDGSTTDAMLVASDDRVTVTQRDGAETYDSSLVTRFQKLWLQRTGPSSSGWLGETTLIVGPQQTEMVYESDQEAWERSMGGGLRSEWTRRVPDGGWAGWRLGLDLAAEHQRFRYDVGDLGGVFRYAGRERGDAVAWYPAVYAEQTQRAGRVDAIPAVRVDAMLLDAGGEALRYSAFTLDPRLALIVRAAESTQITAVVGRHSQFPLIRELLGSSRGNRRLSPEWALQSGIGARQVLTPTLSAEVRLFHSELHDLIVGHDDRFVFEVGLPPSAELDTGDYDNAGSGRVLGTEGLLRLTTARTAAWLGVTVSRSTRVGREREEALFEYDQPLVLTAVVSHRLPRGWQTGARLRYGSGNPYTEVVNHVFDLDSRSWLPIYGETQAERLPAVWTLDLRVDRDWVLRRWILTTYLDLMNATNRRNVEMLNWSADWAEEIPVHGLPVIPAFGLKAAW